MKRILFYFVILSIIFTTTIAFGTESHTSGSFIYEIKGNGTATIIGYSGTGDIIIPQMLDGYTVAAIGDRAFYQKNLSQDLVSVTIPDTVRTIGDFAFWNMNIASINISNNVEYIGKGAFVGCDDCMFRMVANHPKYAVIDDALYDKSRKELIKGKDGIRIPEGIVSIGDYACYGNSFSWNGKAMEKWEEETSYLLPTTIERIGDYAFAKSKFSIDITNPIRTDSWGRVDSSEKRFVMLGKNIQEIGAYAFESLTLDYEGSHFIYDIVYIALPSSVKSIGEGCFQSAQKSYLMKYQNLGLYIASDSLIPEIPDNAFDAADMRIAVYAPIEEIGECAFRKATVYDINLKQVESIGESAFAYASININVGLTLSIPSTCEVVRAYAFKNCKFYIPQGKGGMGYCQGTISIANGVESIEKEAFLLEEDTIISVSLPESLTQIATDAFPLYTKFKVESGSYAQRWVEENAFNYSINGEEQNLDWLNN